MQAPLLHEGLENQLLVLEDHLDRVGTSSGATACITCWQLVTVSQVCTCDKPIYWPLYQAIIRLRQLLNDW